MSFMLAGHSFAGLVGFGSDNAKAFISEAKDLHKGWQFLDLTKELVGCAFAREYLESAPGPKDAAGFLQFLRSCPQDKTFTFLAKFYLLREMQGLYLFRAGLRQNRALAISAARKLLLPVIGVRGSVNYFPTVIREIITVQHRVSRRVREQIERFTSYLGGAAQFYTVVETRVEGALTIARETKI